MESDLWKVWIKHDCMKSEFELKGQFNIGHQWWGVVSQRTVRIIWGVRISEGQIIRAILYKVDKQRINEMNQNNMFLRKVSVLQVWQRNIWHFRTIYRSTTSTTYTLQMSFRKRHYQRLRVASSPVTLTASSCRFHQQLQLKYYKWQISQLKLVTLSCYLLFVKYVTYLTGFYSYWGS